VPVRRPVEVTGERGSGSTLRSGSARPTIVPAPRQPSASEGGFPWRTEEFAARSDADADASEPTAGTADGTDADWNATEDIPEHELPWWRRPKR